MNDTHLESFITVADCGSISKAAKKLYISPQALSQQIERSTRGVTLTEAGRVFYAFAKPRPMPKSTASRTGSGSGSRTSADAVARKRRSRPS